MAYEEKNYERLKKALAHRTDVSERKMFGGVAFMVSGNMCIGVHQDLLMARVGPDQYQTALKKAGAREMQFTGRPMKGFVEVEPKGFAKSAQLKSWVTLCESFASSLPPK
ncbi:MAG: TfoX/Sxy family protein [Acidobacteriota bacterium]